MENGSVHRYKVAVVVLISIAVALTLGAAIRYWLPPWGPLAAFSVLGAGPLIFWSALGALVFDPTKTKDAIVTRDSPALGARLKLALVPVLLGTVVGVALNALWLLPDVRLAATHASASQRLVETLDSAFGDESPDVRLAACQGLAEIGDDTSFSIVVGLTDTEPEVVDCALNVLPASENPPRALAGVAARWHGELMTLAESPEAGENACHLADRIRTAERKGLRAAPTYLMQCALDASSAPSRECCAQAFRAVLGGNDVEPSMVMATPRELIIGGFADSIPSLLQTTYARDPKAEQLRSELRLGTARAGAWSLAVGCEALNVGAIWREPVSTAMAAAVSSDSCTLHPATEKTVRVWTAVCSELFTEERLEAVQRDQGEIFCRTLRGALTADATSSARHGVHSALRVGAEPGRRAAVIEALLDYSANRNAVAATQPRARRKSNSLVKMFQPPKAGESQMEKMFRMMGGSPELVKREDETTEEYIKRYAVEQDQAKKKDTAAAQSKDAAKRINLFD